MGKKSGFVFTAVCPIDLPKTDKGDEEPLADARAFEVADDARFVLALNAFVCLGMASLKRFGRVTTRGSNGNCEHWKNCLANLGAAKGRVDSEEVMAVVFSVTASLVSDCY